jgi:hypothetical protein
VEEKQIIFLLWQNSRQQVLRNRTLPVNAIFSLRHRYSDSSHWILNFAFINWLKLLCKQLVPSLSIVKNRTYTLSTFSNCFIIKYRQLLCLIKLCYWRRHYDHGIVSNLHTVKCFLCRKTFKCITWPVLLPLMHYLHFEEYSNTTCITTEDRVLYVSCCFLLFNYVLQQYLYISQIPFCGHVATRQTVIL